MVATGFQVSISFIALGVPTLVPFIVNDFGYFPDTGGLSGGGDQCWYGFRRSHSWDPSGPPGGKEGAS